VTGPGQVPLHTAIRETGGRAIPVPEPILRAVFERMWRWVCSRSRPRRSTISNTRSRSRATASSRPPIFRCLFELGEIFQSVLDDEVARGSGGFLRAMQSELDERLRKVPNRLKRVRLRSVRPVARVGADDGAARAAPLPLLLPVETHDIDRMPPGRVLVISNHAGQLPFDAVMLQTALLLEAEPPRIARGMGEYWIPQLPVVSFAAARGGAMVGTPHNCAQMLHHGECVAAFPEACAG